MIRRFAVALLVACGSFAVPAMATPVLWEINPSGSITPTGSFYYDAETDTYSGIDVWGAFLTHYDQASSLSTDTMLDMWTYGSSNLVLYFQDSLASGNLEVAFTSTESAWWGILSAKGAGVVTDPPASVPEPGTLMLLGAGLAALGLMRRRKIAVV